MVLNRPFLKDGVWYKRCPHCGEVKSFDQYDNRADRPGKVASWCIACRRADSTNWKKNNPEQARESSRKSAAEFFRKHPERVRENSKRSVYRRLASDPNYKILHSLRRRINKALHGFSKSAATLELIGCSVEFLRDWLQSQFLEGMTWENYGDWHIDHKRPCASFNLLDSDQQRACFHYTNLQPLWALDNIRKSDKTV